MRAGEAAAQSEDRILHCMGFVGAYAAFAAGVDDITGAVGQRKGVGAG